MDVAVSPVERRKMIKSTPGAARCADVSLPLNLW
jgi:hypothetical protein